jgi:hypothetical protein
VTEAVKCDFLCNACGEMEIGKVLGKTICIPLKLISPNPQSEDMGILRKSNYVFGNFGNFGNVGNSSEKLRK